MRLIKPTCLTTAILNLTGFRFSKAYRHGDTKLHALVYFFVDTIGLNMAADLRIRSMLMI